MHATHVAVVNDPPIADEGGLYTINEGGALNLVIRSFHIAYKVDAAILLEHVVV